MLAVLGDVWLLHRAKIVFGFDGLGGPSYGWPDQEWGVTGSFVRDVWMDVVLEGASALKGQWENELCCGEIGWDWNGFKTKACLAVG